jgi:hypothetical protein
MINPTTPEKAPKMKYKVPIFLWFVEKSQRVIQGLVKKAIERVPISYPTFIKHLYNANDGST